MLSQMALRHSGNREEEEVGSTVGESAVVSGPCRDRRSSEVDSGHSSNQRDDSPLLARGCIEQAQT